ncbi:MAG: DUF2326 domain-containing protein [Candidatus Moranbacteria bacterium]|nr:DUF2326 domain-containing protein [Candidatus Moranbacteria bacterium]
MIILSVKSNKETFKEVHFKNGFNLIVAERTDKSSKKDTRNGLGKSSLIQIIRFCLGGSPSRTLQNKELEKWIFTLDFELNGKKYSVSRSVEDKNRVFIAGDCSDWPSKPDIEFGKQVMKTKDWSRVLGLFAFGLQASHPEFKYIPTFGSCRAYFIRNAEEGGYLSPFKQNSSQLEFDKQISNSFLLGLDWTYASKWQILKDRKKVIDQIKFEAQSGILRDMVGSIGELEAKKIRLESEINNQNKELETFNVHPQYQNIENEANEITNKIHELVNENLTDKNLVEFYEKSFGEEKDADADMIQKVYSEAGVVLAGNIKKKLDDVLEFHKNIVVNREEFLKSEILKLNSQISKREQEKKNLSDRRIELFDILKSHKALDEYNKLQQLNLKAVNELKDIVKRIDNLKKFEQGQSSLKIDLELLQQEARVNLSERNEIKEKAIKLFNSNSEILYKSPGILSIDVSKNGYVFNVEIEREGSHGINNMKILCYDLMLAEIWSNRKESSLPLIHDSVLFADVDERQVAMALKLASQKANENNFQYICTMNSDNIPYNDLGDDFKLENFVRMNFTDEREDGGLFGIRF